MRVAVRLFARARDLAKSERVEVDLTEPARVGDVRSALVSNVPALEPLAPALLFAVNNQYADDSSPVDAAAEVACFPPVSGG